MGTYNNNILPNTLGLDLGAPNQLWDAFVRNLNVTTLVSNSVNPSQTGTIRLAAADTATIRNFNNTQDLNLFSKNVSDVLALGGAAGISTSGPAAIGGATTVSGSLTTTGAATIGGALSIAGNVTLTGNLTLLSQAAQGTTLTGSGAAQTLNSFLIPANTLRQGSLLRMTAKTYNPSNVNVTFNWIVGGVSFSPTASSAIYQPNLAFTVPLVAASGAVQSGITEIMNSAGILTFGGISPTFTFNANLQVTLQATWASGSLTSYYFSVELLQ